MFFNEDADGEYPPFWSVHVYLITNAEDRTRPRKSFRRAFKRTKAVPRPTKIVRFKNTARRVSYALKMHFKRRVGHDQERFRAGQVRNARTQRLRLAE